MRITRSNGWPTEPMLRSSPFFLVGPQDHPDVGDVDAIVDAYATAADRPGHRALDDLPTDAGLVEALASTNGGVRAAAERLVRAGGMRAYPAATARLNR